MERVEEGWQLGGCLEACRKVVLSGGPWLNTAGLVRGVALPLAERHVLVTRISLLGLERVAPALGLSPRFALLVVYRLRSKCRQGAAWAAVHSFLIPHRAGDSGGLSRTSVLNKLLLAL